MIMAASSSHEPAAASNRPCCSSSCCCFSLAAAAAAAAAASDQQQQTVVMTDEQLKTFRGQLTTYATICAQLVETHNKQSNPQPSARAGFLIILGIPKNSRQGSSPGQKGMQKMGSKNRWTPTPKQLQILKKLFEEVNGTPTREQIIAVTEQLSQHGPISKRLEFKGTFDRSLNLYRKRIINVTLVTSKAFLWQLPSFLAGAQFLSGLYS